MSTPRQIYAAAALTVAALVAVLATITRINSAHDTRLTVVSITPADGAVLATAPAAVDIRITGKPDPARSHIAVQGPDSSPHNTGPVVVLGDDAVRQAVLPTRDGQVVVAYHIVAVDGRDVSGILRYTVGAATGPQPATPPPAAHAHGVDLIGATLLGLDALVLLGVVVLLLRPRPRRDADLT
ncbi:copper resistance protein CopC [Micromonospora fulviviridis]|uniref:copper resistance protein CopC n=1 Tax=Micromonospora fulviviridis TaxID=47860 RepID=UPI0037A7AED5